MGHFYRPRHLPSDSCDKWWNASLTLQSSLALADGTWCPCGSQRRDEMSLRRRLGSPHLSLPVASGHRAPAFTGCACAAGRTPPKSPASLLLQLGSFPLWPPLGIFCLFVSKKEHWCVIQWVLTSCLLMGPKKKKNPPPFNRTQLWKTIMQNYHFSALAGRQ